MGQKQNFQIKYTSHFERQFLKLIRNNSLLRVKIDKVKEILERVPFYPGLKTHLIYNSDEIGKIWSSRVTGDIRILWSFENNSTIILLEIGGHDDVY